MAGRPKKNNYNELGFTVLKTNRKQVATCTNCKRTLQNTAYSRLMAHRKICRESNVTAGTSLYTLNDVDIQFIDEVHVQSDTNDEPLILSCSSSAGTLLTSISKTHCKSSSNSETSKSASQDPTTTSSTGIPLTSISSVCSESSTNSEKTRSSTALSKRRTMPTFVDVVTNDEKNEINTAIGKFIFGCNIPLRIIESRHFKNLINILRPSYTKLIPNRRVLSTSILEETYKQCLLNAKQKLPTNSVLMVDGWKNSSSNSKTLVSMVHNSDGSKELISAWDLSGECETADRLTEIVIESAKIAKELYNTQIYAVVTDNAATMIKMGKNVKHILWHSTCHSHIGNLLIKDVIDVQLTENVNTVLKEFKNADFEVQIVNKGGCKIKLACDTRWCSYRNAYQSLISNLQFMKQIIIAEQPRKVKANVSNLVFEEQFIEKVKAAKLVLDTVCELINFCQKSDASLADAVNLWLSLDIESERSKLNHRRNMALNVYALTAYYLHPKYDNEKLDREHIKQINHFLLRNLSGNGLDELDQFKMQTGIFEMLYQKDIKKPTTFWRTAEMDCSELAKLALKVLNLPASSAQIERVFSKWGVIHTLIRNRLTFERSEKLLHVYFALNNEEVLSINSVDSGEED